MMALLLISGMSSYFPSALQRGRSLDQSDDGEGRKDEKNKAEIRTKLADQLSAHSICRHTGFLISNEVYHN